MSITTQDPVQQAAEDATVESLLTGHLNSVDAYLANIQNSLNFCEQTMEDADDKAAIGKAMAFLEKAQGILDDQFNDPEEPDGQAG